MRNYLNDFNVLSIKFKQHIKTTTGVLNSMISISVNDLEYHKEVNIVEQIYESK
jgi:hypothetical protein